MLSLQEATQRYIVITFVIESLKSLNKYGNF